MLRRRIRPASNRGGAAGGGCRTDVTALPVFAPSHLAQ
jgi:hypothetical protein